MGRGGFGVGSTPLAGVELSFKATPVGRRFMLEEYKTVKN